MYFNADLLQHNPFSQATAWLELPCTPTAFAVCMIASACHARSTNAKSRLVLGWNRRRAEARHEAGSDSGQEGESEAEDGEEDEEPSSPRDAPDPHDCVIS